MNDRERDLLYATDKHVAALAQTMEQLVSSQVVSNNKLENILSVVTAQTVMAERLNNLDDNLKESFIRVHGKISSLEHSGNVGVKVATARWFVGVLIAYTVSFGTYVVNSLHELDVKAAKQIDIQRTISDNSLYIRNLENRISSVHQGVKFAE